MAEFKMNAEIILKISEAQKSITDFEKKTKQTSKEFSILGRTIKLDTDRMKTSLGAMALVAGGLFGAILLTSPSLRAEFKNLGASILLANVALGEELQPTVAFFTDTLIVLIGVFLQLPEPMLEFIGLTILFTVVISAATVAMLAFDAAASPLILTVIGIAAAIAAVIVLAKMFPEPFQFIGSVFIESGALMRQWANTWDSVFGGADSILQSFEDRIVNSGNVFTGVFTVMATILIGFIQVVSDFVTTVIKLFSDMWQLIGAIFAGDSKAFADALANIFIDVANFIVSIINNLIVDPINALLKAIPGNELKLPRIKTIANRAEGGDISQDGLIFAHRDERISSKSEARANRSNNGNGSGQITITNYNTFKIGNVDSKARIREMLREAEKMNKRSSDRRFKV